MKRTVSFGFTLVELLIVIALIAVLAVALVATLNPIEQINKARDARYKNDAAELLAAIERYYASTLEYPWTTVAGTSTDEFYGGEGSDEATGVCGATCGTAGVLITSGELKDSFRTKSAFSATLPIDKLYVVKGEGSDAVYACFIPKAGTNRSSALMTDIVNDESSNFQPPTDACTTSDWDNLDEACFICVPEVGTAIGVGTT